MPLPHLVDEQHRLHGIPVVRVVRRELVIPLHLAGLRVQRDHARRVEVVADAFFAGDIRDTDCRWPSRSDRAADRTEPGIHVAPHPCSSACPIQVSDPFSPRFGIEYQRQTRSPVDARYASRNPRAPSSPPATPTTSRSPTGSGGDVEL